jgi:hypothetical protein
VLLITDPLCKAEEFALALETLQTTTKLTKESLVPKIVSAFFCLIYLQAIQDFDLKDKILKVHEDI